MKINQKLTKFDFRGGGVFKIKPFNIKDEKKFPFFLLL